jgi:SAM-dependent methyltransferase
VPTIADHATDRLFKERLRSSFPDSFDWEERYVEHESRRIARVFDSGLCQIEGRRVLEFGCHIGATSIVLANLGGRVTGCDIDRNSLALASLNAIRYGQRAALSLVAIGAGGTLPFASGAFDLVICNSVLEYVAPDLLGRTLAEIDRVLRPSGELLIYGTSNRAWPRESHMGRWFVNYVPQRLDRLTGSVRLRGVWPWRIRRAFANYVDVLAAAGPNTYIAARGAAASAWRRSALSAVARVCSWLNFSPGLLTPWIFIVLRKPSSG